MLKLIIRTNEQTPFGARGWVEHIASPDDVKIQDDGSLWVNASQRTVTYGGSDLTRRIPARVVVVSASGWVNYSLEEIED